MKRKPRHNTSASQYQKVAFKIRNIDIPTIFSFFNPAPGQTKVCSDTARGKKRIANFLHTLGYEIHMDEEPSKDGIYQWYAVIPEDMRNTNG